MSSGAYAQLSGRGQKKRPLLGQESPSPRSLLTSLSCYSCPGKEIPIQLKSSCLALDKREGEVRSVQPPLPRSSQMPSELPGPNCSVGRVAPEPELAACSFQLGGAITWVLHSRLQPDRVLGRCLRSVSSQVPFYLSDTCCNCFKVKIWPSICFSCCCGEGGGCYSTPWKEMTCCFSAEGFSPLPLF